jgi:hypothetical protein
MTPEAQFTPDGVLILSPMIGPWDRHEAGSPQWAEALAMHLQHNYKKLLHDGTTSALAQVLREALNSSPHPWEVYPPQAKGDPERWMRLVTGCGWGEIEEQMTRRNPEVWREIAVKQMDWEAHPEHGRTHGGDRRSEGFKVCATDVERDQESARGIRRRLQKRANAGDEHAAELVSQLTAGDITVNQAAIAAGMRQQYIRVRTDNPAKAAASVIERMGREWAIQLATEIAVLSRDGPQSDD